MPEAHSIPSAEQLRDGPAGCRGVPLGPGLSRGFGTALVSLELLGPELTEVATAAGGLTHPGKGPALCPLQPSSTSGCAWRSLASDPGQVFSRGLGGAQPPGL